MASHQHRPMGKNFRNNTTTTTTVMMPAGSFDGTIINSNSIRRYGQQQQQQQQPMTPTTATTRAPSPSYTVPPPPPAGIPATPATATDNGIITNINDSTNDTGSAVDAASSLSPPPTVAKAQENTRRRPIPRKGHTKSRTGCFNCKRRKVKCQENQPRCAQCLRLGLTCEYPISSKTILSVSSNLIGSNPPHAVPSALELEDLKFFYHFIVVAYPPLPLGCDEVWRKTAGISSHYDFLAHAILGLAASHLGLCTGEDYESKALSHRVTAINLLNEKLSQPCKTQQDGDALFAAVMVLAFQAAYLPDAMLEFVTMVRGCDIVSKRLMPDFATSEFNKMNRETHASSMEQLIRAQGENTKNTQLMNGFVTSVVLLSPLCQTEFERTYYASLQSVIKTARNSYAAAWAEFTPLYMLPSTMTNDEFSAFARQDNWTSQLLLVHMFILDFMLGDFILHGSQRQSRTMRKKILITWIEKLGERLPLGYEDYIRWPLTYGKIMIEHQATMVPTREYLDTYATLRTQPPQTPRESVSEPPQAYPSPKESDANLWIPNEGVGGVYC